MTGIERLRELIKDYRSGHECEGIECGELSCGECIAKNVLEPIATQIEREHAEDCYRMVLDYGTVSRVASEMERHVLGHEGMEDSPVARWARELREALGGEGRDHADVVSMSAYDLLPEDERDAVAWVREHGGMDAVRMSCGHADNRRVELCSALGIDLDTGWSDAVADMRPRLMPEGMEWLLEVWPKWSNGEYCKFGDWWKADEYSEREPNRLTKLSIYSPEQLREWEQDEGENYGYEWNFMRPADTTYRPNKVEPPAPKVLDADGAEIRVGDKLYYAKTGCSCIVRDINADGTIELDGHENRGWRADHFAHRAPVIAADGRPLREGETVWDVDGGGPYEVEGFVGKPLCVMLRSGVNHEMPRYPSKLTHERPESWERLEEDADNVAMFFENFNADTAEDIRDLVRRAKALAGDA